MINHYFSVSQVGCDYVLIDCISDKLVSTYKRVLDRIIYHLENSSNGHNSLKIETFYIIVHSSYGDYNANMLSLN